MDVESSICLSDLVPALRWSRPQQVAEALTDPRLPAGWWSSLALSRALGATGMDWICERLARLAASRWDHLPLADVLPALQVHHVDPALTGWPEPVRTAVTGLGGWNRLKRLSAADLAGSEQVIGALFREVLNRVPAASPAAEGSSPAGAVASTGSAGSPVAAAPAPQATPQPAAQPADDEPVVLGPEHIMTRVVDGLFQSFDRLELAVAVHRLFAEDPVSLRELAHRLLVDRDALSIAQRTAEERVLLWLRSSESAPVTGHMFRLTEWLGAAATEEQLVGADPEHPVMVPSLRTPLWRVLVTLMPDRRLQDGWLVVGNLRGLQQRTRQLLASAPRDADYAELLGELGVRLHSAKAWLEALPPESSADSGFAHAPSAEALGSLPRRTPGANGHHHRGGQPIPQAPAIDPTAALAALSALSGGGGRNGSGENGLPANGLPERRPGANGYGPNGNGSNGYGQANGAPNGVPSGAPNGVPSGASNGGGLGGFGGMSSALAGLPGMSGGPSTPPPSPASDPRRWQRIDVTTEHLRGGPVTVPEGYAAQLGMRPGTLLSVTGPGNNAVVLVWPGDRQPVFDSLQPVLMKLNARPGDQVYVTVDGYRLEAQLTG
ncbi:hypothetical protein [Nonomuraea soli]|uniref:Uncharacterized protein n=1 Tax=Nonomuraea soli TaxID=1032476 RepID=A0A7W0CPH1_9ACTN|nr:hypothetical protein [Nonomuraea soli]MBA2894809.1 hypothetical protein [Nonomuraea soli]